MSPTGVVNYQRAADDTRSVGAVQSSTDAGFHSHHPDRLPAVSKPLDWRADLDVLLIDDNRPSLDLVGDILERLGCRVTLTENPQKASQWFRRGTFPLVICDYVMPQRSGLQLCQEMKAMLPSTVFFLITGASADYDLYNNAYRAGVDDFVFKPADLHAIKQKLQGVERKLKMSLMLKEVLSASR